MPVIADEAVYLGTLLRLSQILNSSLDFEQVLKTAIDEVVKFIGAERGFILLVQEETNRVLGRAIHAIEPKALEHSLAGTDPANRAEVSRTIVQHVMSEQAAVLCANALEDRRFADHTSIRLGQVRSVICLPLQLQDRVMGVIYLDSRLRSGAFKYRHVEMLTAFANQASVAIENARMVAKLKGSLEERIRLQAELHSKEAQRLALEATFGRNVPRQIMQFLMESPAHREPGGRACEATIMFVDIRDFTAYVASRDPVDVMNELNELFAEAAPVIAAHEGLVYQYTGDGLMAVFGVPYPLQSHPRAALDAACEIVHKVSSINRQRRADGRPAWRIGCGIDTGRVVAGNVGSADRCEFTVAGNPVNMAARLQGLTKEHGGQIVASATTCERAGKVPEGGRAIQAKVRGRDGLMSGWVFEFDGVADPA